MTFEQRRQMYRDAMLREAVGRGDFLLKVQHRTLHHHRHPLRRRLPGYAERELASVRDRDALLQQVPTHLVDVWREGALHDAEMVSVPLTGWSNSGGSCAVLTFDSVLADLDKKPLLVSSVAGALEVASEVTVTFRGRPLRVWRYGRPNAQVLAHGKRTVHLFPGGAGGPRATDLREATGGSEQWHAATDDGACLLQLDIPSFGTDALEDAWHLTRAQVALPSHELYRFLMPSLYPQWPPVTSAAAAPLVPAVAAAEGGADLGGADLGGADLGEAELELTIYTATGQRLATGRSTCRLSAAPPALREERRVRTIEVAATADKEAVMQLRLHGSARSAPTPPFAPRAGILSLVLRQRRQVVAATCTHFTGAVGGLEAGFVLGEAVYEDASGVTQRETMDGRLTYSGLRVVLSGGGGEADGVPPAGSMAGSREGEKSVGWEGEKSVGWEVRDVRLVLLVPAQEVDGVTFQPRACGLEWARDLRRLVDPTPPAPTVLA